MHGVLAVPADDAVVGEAGPCHGEACGSAGRLNDVHGLAEVTLDVVDHGTQLLGIALYASPLDQGVKRRVTRLIVLAAGAEAAVGRRGALGPVVVSEAADHIARAAALIRAVQPAFPLALPVAVFTLVFLH